MSDVKVAFLTDSCSDIPQELTDKYGIDVIGFHIMLDGKEYLERKDMTNDQFYEMMRQSKSVPTTAAITQLEWVDIYAKYVDAGIQDLVHLCINAGGSSTYNNAVKAAELLEDERPGHKMKIHLIDSHTYSMPYGWYLCECARKVRAGEPLDACLREMQDKLARVEICLAAYSLKQMKKSGRVSAAAAVVGDLMGIRPIISLNDGISKVEAKVRGDNNVFCGGASKAVDLQLDHTKAYRAVLRLGQRTDTGDVTGTVLETAPVTAGEQELLAVLPQFLGPRMQTPPMYSAVKINGQPLYKLAREGKTVERKARPIEILDIRYEGSPAENEYALTVKCSKGTYIRVLLEEIAEAMGQKGTMSALRRVAAGVYSEADAHTLEEIQAAKDAGPEALQALMLPVESVFASLPLLVADERVEQHLYNGCPTSRYPAADGRYRVRNAGGQFLGLANVVNGVLKVEKLFVERN